MDNQLFFPVEAWKITETSFSIESNYCNETIFALSNGYIGTRGTHPEEYDFAIDEGMEGVFLNGFYESQPVRYGEWNYGFPTESQSMLNLPDPKIIQLFVDEEVFDLRVGKIDQYTRVLHLDQGLVSREVTWTSPLGRQIRVETEQLVSLSDKNLMMMSYKVTPLNFGGKLRLRTEIFTAAENHTRKANPLVDYGPYGTCLE